VNSNGWGRTRRAFNLAGLLIPDPGIDNIGGEDVAPEQELVVVPESLERVFERPGGAGNPGEFLGLEVVDVLVDRVAGAGLGLDAVERGHEHGGVEQVGVRRAVGGPELDPATGRAGAVDGDSDHRSNCLLRLWASIIGAVDMPSWSLESQLLPHRHTSIISHP